MGVRHGQVGRGLRIEQVVEAEPSLAGPGAVALPYRTDLFFTERLDRAG